MAKQRNEGKRIACCMKVFDAKLVRVKTSRRIANEARGIFKADDIAWNDKLAAIGARLNGVSLRDYTAALKYRRGNKTAAFA